MGQAKKHMEENRYNDEVVDFLENLISREAISGAAAGIASQAIDKGMRSLSDKQNTVIDSVIDAFKRQNECKDCQGDQMDSLADYVEVHDEGRCFNCRDRHEAMEKA